MPVAALAAASQAAQQLASWRARQKQPCPWQREGPGASSVAFQLRDTEDRACPESLASSHSSCSGADRGGSATGPQQQLQQQHRTLSDHLPILRAGPCCWEPRTAHRAGGATGQRPPRSAPEDPVPEPLPGYRGPVWASPVMEMLEFICKGEN